MSERDHVAEFHAHLDKCEQCATNPMMPCTFGGWLLRRAAMGGIAETPITEAPVHD